MNKRTGLKISILALAVATVTGFAKYQDLSTESVTLRLNVEPGKAYVYEMKSESTMSMMGQEFSTKNEMKQTYSVKKKDEAGTQIEVSNSDVKITTDVPMMSEEQIANMKKSLENAKSMMTFDAQGKAKNDEKSQASRGMMSMMTMAGAGGSAAFEFPEGPVKAGTTWNTELDLGKMLGFAGPAAANMKAEKPIPITYTVEKIEKRGDHTIVTIKTLIDGKTDMKLPPEAAQQGGPESITIQNKTESTSEIDAGTGLVIKLTSTTKNTVNLGGFGEMITTSKLTMTRS